MSGTSASEMIRMERLCVRFGETLAVDNIAATVPAGEWVGLIGANGAGKTTLIRAIAQLEHYEGSVFIEGEDLSKMPRGRRARLLAYLPQSPELPVDMSVSEYVLLGRTPHIGYFSLETAKDRQICADLIERLGLATMKKRHLGSLSGGEQQRVVLARALAQDTRVLLLDEPTSALDLGRRVEVLELIDAMRYERGLTIVSAMHDLTLASQFADKLMLLSRGQVVTTGLPADVISEETLTKHFDISVRVLVIDDGELIVVPRARQSRESRSPAG